MDAFRSPHDLHLSRRRFDLTVGGRRLCAEWLEPDTGSTLDSIPLVFLHEGLGSIAQWTGRVRGGETVDVPAHIAAATGCPALVYERAGFGGSDPLPSQRTNRYLYDEAWTVLPKVLDAVGVPRCLPIGHSDGGTIALLFAARFPGRTVALVSEAAHVIVEEVTLRGIRAARDAYHAPESRLREALVRFHGDKTEATFSGWADVWLTPEFVTFDMRDQLPAVTCPSLILQGAGDEYGTPAQVEAIADGVSGPCEPWIVPDCRHVPHFQASQVVLPRIIDFVKRMTSRASQLS